MNKAKTLLFLSLLLMLQVVAAPALAQKASAEQISAALQRALDRSDYAQKKRLAELRDVADADWTGFRLVGEDGELRLSASTAQGEQAHKHPEGSLSCSMCESHLFNAEDKLAHDSPTLLFTRPRSSFAVASDIHSQWTSDNGQVELRCGFCGAHLGYVDPGETPESPLQFAVEPGKLKTTRGAKVRR